MMYSIEPTDHWRVGDRAYCMHTMRIDGRPVLEAGRIYEVVKARQHKAMMNDRVALAGVEASVLMGLSTSLFICLRQRGAHMAEIAQLSRHKWYDAYRETAAARAPLPTPVEPEEETRA